MTGQDAPGLDSLADRSIARIVTTASDAQRASIALYGEIDAAAAPALRRQVRRHLRAGRRVIHIDADAVTFIDSLALGALAAMTDRCARADGSLTLTNVPTHIRRVIQIAGLEPILLIDTAAAETPDI
ncbi:MAG TPA: STAS domain-containing protein [Jatrophihabitans sp.]|jgi:anti-sigma B factor antagonist|nr:STAS domain-containing protein [Jatrophihabitans sp.]